MKKVLLALAIFLFSLPSVTGAADLVGYPPFLDRPNQAAMKIDFDIHPYIEKAKKLLAAQKPPGFRVARKARSFELENAEGERIKINVEKGKLESYEVIMAVMNVDERKIKIVRNTPYSGHAARPDKFIVDWYRLNGLNTPFRISEPDGYIVLAIRRVGSSFKDRIYVPFAPELDVPRLRKEGWDYVQALPKVAEEDLREKRVLSRAYEGKLLADVVPSELVIALANIEHIDPKRFEKASPEELVNEILVTFALNQEDTYRYASSPKAKANGIMQFIRKTYHLIFHAYPKAELVEDFIRGTSDHKNSAKGSMLLFDSDWRDLLRSEQRFYLRRHPEERLAYQISAYNCSSRRTIQEIARWGERWREHVPPETRIFLKKFEAVWKLFGSGNYASLD